MAHPSSKPGPLSTTILSVVTLIAFAANSLLCRGALGPGTIDPIGFTLLRIASGAITLTLIARAFKKDEARVAGAGSWTAGLALFAYALAFSFAYVSIDAGTGALILFAAVQATMIGVGIAKGERPSALEWIGLAIAMGGLVFLLQLSVPVIAAFGGLLFLAEPPTLRLAISSAMVLGGVGMAVASRKLPQQG